MLEKFRKDYLDDPYTDEYIKHEVNEEDFQNWKREYRGERTKSKLWDTIGIHRPLGGFWHNFILQLFILIIPSLWAGFLIKWLYPIPVMKGYKQTYSGLFVLIFTIFDLGTSATISRFIADENIKNPGEMVKYIQYFIWYQSITGLIQVTAISYWALNYASQGELALGVWIMLVVSTKQWPGFPGVFKGILDALQLYSKKNLLAFFQGQVFELITEVFFVISGKMWGENNPEIGPILGIAIGATFGTYLDDVIVSIIGAYILSKELGMYGITFKRFFLIEFDWDLVKKCSSFGIKMGAPGLISATVKITALTLSMAYIPQYTTFIALSGMAAALVATSERLVEQSFDPLFVEAYQNDCKRLCQYYNAHAWRFKMINSGFAVSIMIMVISIFPQLFMGIGLEHYMLTMPFLIPALLNRMIRPYTKYPSGLLVAGHKPNQLAFINVSLSLLRLLAWYLTIVVFKIQDLGIGGIVYCLVLTEFPVEIVGFICSMGYIQKAILKLKFSYYQTFVVLVVSTSILFFVFIILRSTVLLKLFEYNFWVAIIVSIVFIFIFVLMGYFPLTVYLGGWDENTISDFEKAVIMSGASKLVVKPLRKFIISASKRAKLHNQWKFNEDDAFRDIYYLMTTRDINRTNQL